MIGRVFRATVLIILIYLQVGPALACACCADPGARYERSGVISGWELAGLDSLRSDGRAEIYYSGCGEECIKGLMLSEEWNGSTLSIGWEGVTLSLTPSGASRASAILTAAIPDQFDWFATDPTPGDRRGSAGGLYSETTFHLNMQGTGPSWTGGADTFPARLILIGQSTACMEMGRSSYWMLDVDTHDVAFRLFGGFRPVR